MIKDAQSLYNMDPLPSRRWSPRSFSEKSVSREELLSLFEAASWAPSSFNEQPWRFIAARKKEDSLLYNRLWNLLSEKNQEWAGNAPVLVLTVARTEFSHNNKPNFWGLYDTGQSMAWLTVQAEMREIKIHQMAGFNREKARGEFDIPAEFEPLVMFTAGYEGDPEELPESWKKMEVSARKRKSLESVLFSGTWEEPSGLF